jgi:drug/metabolite transporter (DMT)-like permease
VLIGFAGAVILALPSFSQGADAQVIGLLAALVATCCYAVTLNYARRFAGKVEPFAVASASLTGAALVSIPVALAFTGMPVITLPQTWAALFGISVFSTSFSFLLVYWLLPRVGATNLSLNTFITPISAILLGVLVLHERFELVHVIGILVIFFGLIFIDGRLVKGWRKAPA